MTAGAAPRPMRTQSASVLFSGGRVPLLALDADAVVRSEQAFREMQAFRPERPLVNVRGHAYACCPCCAQTGSQDA